MNSWVCVVLVIMFMLFPSFPIRKHSSFCSDDYAYGLLFMSYTTCHAYGTTGYLLYHMKVSVYILLHCKGIPTPKNKAHILHKFIVRFRISTWGLIALNFLCDNLSSNFQNFPSQWETRWGIIIGETKSSKKG